MGDIVSLVEKAQEVVDEEEAALLEKKFRKGKFDLDDLLKTDQKYEKDGWFRFYNRNVARSWKVKRHGSKC